MLNGPVEALHRVHDALERDARLFDALVGEVQRAAVVRLQHEEAQHGRVDRLQDVAQQEEVVERLRHLLAVDLQHAAMHPVVREGLSRGRLGLGALVLVVREDEVGPAAVNVERQAEVFLRHARALDVPARAPLAPRRLPRGLAGLRGLPQREVERVVLAVLDALGAQVAVAGLHLVDVAARERAVARERAHAEVNVAVLGGVRVAAVDEVLHERDHRVDLLRGLRAHGRVLHVHRVHVLDERLRVLLGNLGGGAALLVCLVDDLVVHVGHILDEDHVELAPLEVAADHVEAHEGARVANVDVVVHRRPADVHLHLAVLERLEVDLLVHFGVVYANHRSPNQLSRAGTTPWLTCPLHGLRSRAIRWWLPSRPRSRRRGPWR